jgi:flagellar secretion chaperone FliS
MITAQAYVTDSIVTAGPAQLVLALYDGALGAIERARAMLVIGAHDAHSGIEAVHTQLVKAQRIVTELRVTLDHERGGDIARNLDALYEFCLRTLVDANLAKDSTKLTPASDVLRSLRDTWAQACC